MKLENIVLVQRSFKTVAPIAEKVGAMFYDRLFERAPEIRRLFPQDMHQQEKKLMQMLATVVNGLHRLQEFMPAVEELARRHGDYGVLPEHYAIVGDTLIWALEQALGDAFTPPVRVSWMQAYATLSGWMIAATAEKSPDGCESRSLFH